MNITQEQALRRFPELHALLHVRDAGWSFRLIGSREQGIEGIVASRNKRQWTDALWVYDQGMVVGIRILDDVNGGGTVWHKDSGTLPEIVNELLGLPDPDDRRAPRLVKGSSSRLWTP